MRLMVSFLTMLLFFGVLGFVLTNLDTKVAVKTWETVHTDVPLYGVVILAVLAGILYVAGIAVVEGAAIRLANRRLEREVRRLETELVYLRTQPSGAPRIEPDAVPAGGEASRPHADASPDEGPIPNAPVYDAEGSDWAADPGDDAYSGGRAV